MYHIHHLTTRTTRTSCTTHGWKSRTSIDLAANLLVNHRNEILARYWPAGNMPNRDTKTNMASRMRRKRSVAFYSLDCLITADFYGLFTFRLLVHKSYCYFSSELVFLVAFILYFRGTKTRESRLFLPFSLYF